MTTGNDKYATTESGVNLNITGTEGTSRQLRITDTLNRGQTQTFTYTNVKSLGEVKTLDVGLGEGHDGWYLEYIVLQNAGRSGSQYICIYKGWLSNNKKDHTNPQTVTLTCSEESGKLYVELNKHRFMSL